MKNIRRISKRTLTMVGLVGLFILLSFLVAKGYTQGFDEGVLRALRAGSANPVGPGLMPEVVRDITALGSGAIGITALILATIWLGIIGKWRTAVLQVVMVLLGIGFVFVLKNGFDRSRPDLFEEMLPRHTASYPSGHTMTGTVVYFTIAMFMMRDQFEQKRRIYYWVAAALVAASVGLSRVYLGAHFPTDVIAAWCLGLAWAFGAGAIADLVAPLGASEPDVVEEPAV